MTAAHPFNSVGGMFLKYFQENMAAAITGLTALSFAVSAAREWAYYYGLGARDFLSMTSPAAYTSAALLWMPTFLLAIAIIAVIEMFLSRTEGFRSEEEIVQGSRTPMRTALWRDLPALLLFGASTVRLAVMLFLDSELRAIDWLIPAYGCWVVFFAWFNAHHHMENRLTKNGKKVLLFGPFFAALIILNGYDEAQDDLALLSGEYRIVKSNGEVENDVQLLRATSNGILILSVPTGDISFLTYSSFNRIEPVVP